MTTARTTFRILLAIAIVAATITGSRAFAQEGMPPMPDSSYGAAPDAFQSPTDLGMPAPDDLTDPNTVTIPIPGGGEINVDGPDAPNDTPLPTLPGAQWGNEQQNP